jgi:quercetin dioxygenase-like cupin family protein
MGVDFCPAFHREYVVAGRIRYRLQDGTSIEAGPGDHLVIEPGHAAEVLGDEECVLLDWYGPDPDAGAHEGHDHPH